MTQDWFKELSTKFTEFNDVFQTITQDKDS